MNEDYHKYVGYTRYVDFKRLDFIVQTVRSYFNNRTKLRGLDVGCGKGDICISLAFSGYSMVGIDISSECVKEAKRRAETNKIVQGNLTFLIGDAENLPFKVSSFNFTICSEVLEHLKRPERALNLINKVLKERGLLIVTVPNGYGPYSLIYDHFRNKVISKIFPKIGHSCHAQTFTLSKITKLIRGSGFEILNVAHSDFISFFCRESLNQKHSAIMTVSWQINCHYNL